MLDGSGTILLRLFLRRVTEAIFRVARTTPTGKLPHPATIAMDEQPSYGRMNYLMRLTGTMRSYNLSILFGIQNNAQGKLVYGSDYWDAISENVISRRIALPRGLTGSDAEDIALDGGLEEGTRWMVYWRSLPEAKLLWAHPDLREAWRTYGIVDRYW
ncbi:hypothetical protein GCM10008955_42060 [Deinococcus malanensis]|uniref:TraD/TraG TraM recognition site domain-containing protein n=2 Tax=Deinococcus malanensis TaxID=1706855 RepID=A0ABQ2F2M6_9DEIO|nr:hypothetical protein GCM10008955_42060 [Deinococcus malanensis]